MFLCVPSLLRVGTCVLSHAQWPRVGSGVVRMDPLRFLAGCRTRLLNQALFLFYILACFFVLVFIRAPFYVLLVFIICVVSLLVVLVKLSLLAKLLARKTPLSSESSPLQILALA